MTALTLALWVVAVVLVTVGVLGVVIPILPGSPLVFAGLLLAAWAEEFTYVGPAALALIGGLAVLTWAVDLAAGAFGARRFGASRRAVVGAAIGALVGLFFGLPGILLGPFLGAVLGELSMRRSFGQAGRAGIGTTLGLAIGAAVKLALVLSMVGTFAIARFF